MADVLVFNLSGTFCKNDCWFCSLLCVISSPKLFASFVTALSDRNVRYYSPRHRLPCVFVSASLPSSIFPSNLCSFAQESKRSVSTFVVTFYPFDTKIIGTSPSCGRLRDTNENSSLIATSSSTHILSSPISFTPVNDSTFEITFSVGIDSSALSSLVRLKFTYNL